MLHRSLSDAVNDLRKNNLLLESDIPANPNLVMAEVQRRAYAAQAPAILFNKVKNSQYPAISNLYGSNEQIKFLFRKTEKNVKALIEAKASPEKILQNPFKIPRLILAAFNAIPKPTLLNYHKEIPLSSLPQIVSWPKDGGAFITLPQVFTFEPNSHSIFKSNIGMYRVQISGNSYLENEIGLHYQIHRGIGIHHTKAKALQKPLKVTIMIGGPPAHAFAAVMPLPEEIPEIAFAGALAGRGFRFSTNDGYLYAKDADFIIHGEITPDLKPEGPFGDHLGYYAKKHDFPVLKVKRVLGKKKGGVYPFTVVGRPPQEDSSFGKFIHTLTKSMVPVSIPGLKAMHAVDEAGVHPLLLAMGSERYLPYLKESQRQPYELLTIANAILGFNQASLAKYLMIIDHAEYPELDLYNTPAFFKHLLERVDWRRDLHFHTNTTMDTLDYSSLEINRGSKLVIAATNPIKRELAIDLPKNFYLPKEFNKVQIIKPGILAISGLPFSKNDDLDKIISKFETKLSQSFPLIIITDDADFVKASWHNFLWATFTRSDPASDIYGVESFTKQKHWGCLGPLIIDARKKPHHAPELIVNKKTIKEADDWIFQSGFSKYF